MDNRTWHDILNTLMSASTGLLAVLSIGILAAPNYTREAEVAGLVVLVAMLVHEWRERREFSLNFFTTP